MYKSRDEAPIGSSISSVFINLKTLKAELQNFLKDIKNLIKKSFHTKIKVRYPSHFFSHFHHKNMKL